MTALSAPVTVELVVTERCNHRCIHCFNPDIPLSPEAPRHSADFDRVADELSGCGVMKVIVTGGEPLEDKDTTLRFIRTFQSRGMQVSLNTNLTLMDREFAERLSALGRVPFVFASLPSTDRAACDSITLTEGSYDAIMRGVSVCDSAGIDIGLNIVVSGRTRYCADDICGLIAAHPSVKHVSLSPVVPPICDRSNALYDIGTEDLLSIRDTLTEVHGRTGVSVGCSIPLPMCIVGDIPRIRDYGSMCSAGRSHCTVHYRSGMVTACAHDSREYGNIYDEHLGTIWRRMDDWRDDTYLEPECARCRALPLCSGLCRMSGERLRASVSAMERIPSAEFPLIGDDEPLTMNPDILLRDESFGGVLFVENKYVLLRREAYRLVGELMGMGTFTVSGLDAVAVVDDSLRDALSYLLRLGAVMRDA